MTTIEFLEHLLDNARNNEPLKEGLYYDGRAVIAPIGGTDWENLHMYSKHPPRQINGFTVPAPAKYKLDKGTIYYIPNLHSIRYYAEGSWLNHSSDLVFLERGIVFHTPEAAIATCKAMLGINPND